MSKLLEFFINRNYFKILHEYDSLEMPKHKINHIQLFQKDKIICLFNNYIKLYDIYEKIILCKIKISMKDYYYNSMRKIKIFGEDKFIIFNSEEYEYTEEELRIYKFIDDNNKKDYSCKEITRIPEKANNILIKGRKMICIKKGFLNIYILIKDRILQLQTKIIIPQIIDKYSFNKGFFLNKNIKVIEYGNKYIEFWSLNKYELTHENRVKTDNYILGNKLTLEVLNDNDNILYSIFNCIYLYSFRNKKIIKKIIFENYWEILGIYITKNEEIYVNDRNKIYTLDLKNKTYYALTRFNYQFENSLIILEDEKNHLFIINSYYEIQIFKRSICITLMQDLRYVLISYLYYILERYYNRFNIKYINIFFIISLIIFLMIDNYNKSLYVDGMQNYALRISIILYIIIHLFNLSLFYFHYLNNEIFKYYS